MKSRNREVNIFNMSILDVLCGALGAFCFMMLALFPYYKPTHLSAEDRQSYQSGQQLQKEIQKLQSDLQQAGPRGAAAMMQQIQRTLKSAQSQLAHAQENLSRTRAAMEQAQQQAQQAQQQAKQAQAQDNHDQSQLAMKHPLVLQCWYAPDGDKVTIYIHNPAHGTKGETAPPFDPSREQSNAFVDTMILEGTGSASWVIADTVPGDFAVYYRLDKPQSITGEVEIVSVFVYKTHRVNLPKVTLTAAHPYAEAGIIRIDGNGGAKFIPASASGSASASAPVANSPASPMQTPL